MTVTDTFTDVDGVVLEDHVSEGFDWERLPSAGVGGDLGTITVLENAVHSINPIDGFDALYFAGISQDVGEEWVELDIELKTPFDTRVPIYIALQVDRSDVNAYTHGYWAIIRQEANLAEMIVEILKDGASIDLVIISLPGLTFTFRAEYIADSFDVSIDGGLVLSAPGLGRSSGGYTLIGCGSSADTLLIAAGSGGGTCTGQLTAYQTLSDGLFSKIFNLSKLGCTIINTEWFGEADPFYSPTEICVPNIPPTRVDPDWLDAAIVGRVLTVSVPADPGLSVELHLVKLTISDGVSNVFAWVMWDFLI